MQTIGPTKENLNYEQKINLDISSVELVYQFNAFYDFNVSVNKITEPSFLENNDFTFAEIFDFKLKLANRKNKKNNICEFFKINKIRLSLDKKEEKILLINDKLNLERVLKIQANEFELLLSENFVEFLHFFSELSISLLLISNSYVKKQIKNERNEKNGVVTDLKNIDILQNNVSFIINDFKFKIEDTTMNVYLHIFLHKLIDIQIDFPFKISTTFKKH